MIERLGTVWRRLGAVGGVLLACAGTSAAQEIRLCATARVAGSAVHLADVAMLSGAEEAVLADLGQLPIAVSDVQSTAVVVRLADVRAAVSRADWNLLAIRLVGATQCVVTRAMTPANEPAVVAGPHPAPMPAPAPAAAVAEPSTPAASAIAHRPRTLESAAIAFLRERLAPAGQDVTVRFSAASRAVLSLGSEEATFEIQPRGPVAPGLVHLEIAVRQGSQPVQTVSVIAEVSLARRVVVARQAINQGRVIRASDVALEPRETGSSGEAGLTEIAAAVGQEAKSFIRPGQAVRARDVRAAPLVRRGELVTVWSKRGGLTVQTVGRAGRTGAAGEWVTVRNPANGEMFDARVVGARTVSVEPGTQLAVREP